MVCFQIWDNPIFIVIINTVIQEVTLFSIYILDGILKQSKLGQVTNYILVMAHIKTDDVLTVTDNNAILQR